MATLEVGRSYSLSAEKSLNKNERTLIFVKLTDSALKALEDYNYHKDMQTDLPRFQISGNEGKIFLPSYTADDRIFTFNLSSTSDIEGPQGSFECIQQLNNKFLKSLGPIPYKMRIHAKDDVYEATRQKMAVAEEEVKKNCARVIKCSAPGIGRKVKVHKRSNETNSSSSSISGKKVDSPSVPSIKNSSGASESSLPPPHYSESSQKTAAAASAAAAAARSNSKDNPEIVRRSLRERIVQLLALKTFKKPELFAKLYKDGLKEKDKNHVTSILQKVAHLKDNHYILSRHIWSEVQEEWPFYSEEDRKSVRKRKLDACDVSSSEVPIKRSDAYPETASKRSRAVVPAATTPDVENQFSSSPVRNSLDQHTSDGSPYWSSASPNSPAEPATNESPEGVPEYFSQYPPIQSIEQRSRYKSDFNQEYEEYKNRFSIMDRVSRRFSQMEEKLRQKEKDSEDWKSIQNQIIREYQEKQGDKEFCENQKRFFYLHEKLSHIKMLVQQYDLEHS